MAGRYLVSILPIFWPSYLVLSYLGPSYLISSWFPANAASRVSAAPPGGPGVVSKIIGDVVVGRYEGNGKANVDDGGSRRRSRQRLKRHCRGADGVGKVPELAVDTRGS
ncbi:hypothetical protein QBC39DRAFT_331660 [Podospora conica]|nr:hypothetical protein QBC39DRAFT_331660 [Schizothecium conicum]